MLKEKSPAPFSSTYTKIGMIKRRLSWTCARMIHKFVKCFIFLESNKMVEMILLAKQKYRHRCREQIWIPSGKRGGWWDELRDLRLTYIHCYA